MPPVAGAVSAGGRGSRCRRCPAPGTVVGDPEASEPLSSQDLAVWNTRALHLRCVQARRAFVRRPSERMLSSSSYVIRPYRDAAVLERTGGEGATAMDFHGGLAIAGVSTG